MDSDPQANCPSVLNLTHANQISNDVGDNVLMTDVHELLDRIVNSSVLLSSLVGQDTIDDCKSVQVVKDDGANVINCKAPEEETKSLDKLITPNEEKDIPQVDNDFKSKQTTISLVPYRINDSSGSDSEEDSESSDSEGDSESSTGSDSSDGSESSSSSALQTGSERDESGGECKVLDVPPKPSFSKPVRKSVKTAGELGLEDLPPIGQLHITVPEVERIKIGLVHGIIDRLVTVQSSWGTAALDLDSFLFLEDGSCLGQVFDVFGPVIHPFYSVRFNSNEDILARGITIGNPVYCAPQRQDLTSYVFVDRLRQERGSDASWKNNNEPPAEHLDYSDDEQERHARTSLKCKKKGGEENSLAVEKSDSTPNWSLKRKRRMSRPRPQPNTNTPQSPMLSPASFIPPSPPCVRFDASRFVGPTPTQAGSGNEWRSSPFFPPRHPWNHEGTPPPYHSLARGTVRVPQFHWQPPTFPNFNIHFPPPPTFPPTNLPPPPMFPPTLTSPPPPPPL